MSAIKNILTRQTSEGKPFNLFPVVTTTIDMNNSTFKFIINFQEYGEGSALKDYANKHYVRNATSQFRIAVDSVDLNFMNSLHELDGSPTLEDDRTIEKTDANRSAFKK